MEGKWLKVLVKEVIQYNSLHIRCLARFLISSLRICVSACVVLYSYILKPYNKRRHNRNRNVLQRNLNHSLYIDRLLTLFLRSCLCVLVYV